MKTHYAHGYLSNPPHKITVDLVGLGGTGSQVLTGLGRMNEALAGLNHPGFHVTSWDPDEVSEANMGRQLFSPADLGQNKAVVLTTRINRFFGYEWQAMPAAYTGKQTSNITITCIDTAKGRVKIHEKIYSGSSKVLSSAPTDTPYYWLDIGNLQKTGQVVLGTLRKIPQPKMPSPKMTLPTVVQKFPQLKKIKEADQGPSCSLAEALEKQDLFINSTLAQLGCNLLWKLFREKSIKHHGCYVNLESMNVNPIPIN